ncbi:unnamed protein product, partial [Cyprideis torosa]
MSTEIIFEERRLTELRVIDLKAELERRSLDKNGVKSQLMERLKEAMENEGLDPESHIFQVGKSGAGETPGKTKRSEADESVEEDSVMANGSEDQGKVRVRQILI